MINPRAPDNTPAKAPRPTLNQARSDSRCLKNFGSIGATFEGVLLGGCVKILSFLGTGIVGVRSADWSRDIFLAFR